MAKVIILWVENINKQRTLVNTVENYRRKGHARFEQKWYTGGRIISPLKEIYGADISRAKEFEQRILMDSRERASRITSRPAYLASSTEYYSKQSSSRGKR